MKPIKSLIAVAAVATLALTGCAQEADRPDCDDSGIPMLMFFNTADGRYHYGSPKGKTVPDHKVPASARKHPGYKPPAVPKTPNRVNIDKPKPAAPRVGGRR